MSTPTGNSQKSVYVRKAEPGFLENLGVKYYHYLGKKSGTAGLHNLTIDELPADVTLVAALYNAKVILSSMVVKFLLIRIAGKGEMRNAFSWVGIPVTGLWIVRPYGRTDIGIHASMTALAEVPC